MRELLRRFFSRPVLAAELLVATFLVAILNLASSLFVMQILRRYISIGVDGTLYVLSGGMCVALVFFFFIRWARTRVALGVGAELDAELADRVFDALARMKISALEGVCRTKIQGLTDKLTLVQAAYDATNLLAVIDAPFALVYIAVGYHISSAIAGIGAAGMLLMFVLGMGTLVWSEGPSKTLKEVAAEQQGHAQSALAGTDTVRAFNAAPFLQRIWDAQLPRIADLRNRLSENKGLYQTVIRVTMIVVSTAVYVRGAMEVVWGDMNTGALIGASIITARAVQAMAMFAQSQLVLGKARDARREIDEFLALPAERDHGEAPDTCRGKVAFEGLSFGYRPGSEPVINNLDLTLAPGTIMVASGYNGSGKTTLARLAMGLLEPTRGRITVDGHDLAELSLAWWRRQVVYMPQEPTFLNASVRDNIRVANPLMDEAALRRVVMDADLTDFLLRLPKHLDSPIVDSGRSLPVGIKRRLALARGLAADGAVAILDEPSEGLDAEGARRLYGLLQRLAAQGKTVLIFSHDPVLHDLAHVRVDLAHTPEPAVDHLKRPEPSTEGGPGTAVSVEAELTPEEPPGERAPVHGAGWGMHLVLNLCCALCFAFVLWGVVHDLDINAMVQGRVVPLGYVKRIQHLEGGIVKILHVREGARVHRGDPLVTLEREAQEAAREEMRIRYDGLRVDVARLAAEAEGHEPVFDAELERDRPDMVDQARKLYAVRMRRHENEMAELRHKVEQYRLLVREYAARRAKRVENLTLLEQEIAISEELLKDELTSEMRHLALLREATDLRSGVQQDRVRIQQAQAKMQEAEAAIEEQRTTFRQKAGRALREARRDLGELAPRLRVRADAFSRSVIRAPVEGVVKSVGPDAPGEVVGPGETIVTLVPEDEKLVIQGRLEVDDIGFVQEGQTAEVRLHAPDAWRFGHLRATVAFISPDAFTADKGKPYYMIRLETDKDRFELRGNTYYLYPGMVVDAYIKTGSRTLVEYLLSPYFIDA